MNLAPHVSFNAPVCIRTVPQK